MVDAFLAPVAGQQVHVEIPALHLRLALRRGFERARTEGYWRESGRAAQAFLRAAVNGVDAPLVESHWATAQRSDGVEEHERPGVADELRNLFHRRERTGAGFGVDNGDELRLRHLLQRVGHLLRFDDAAPRRLDLRHFRAATLGHVAHARAEHAVDANDDLVPGFDEVHETELHPRAAGAAHGKRHFVLREENLAEHDFDLVHHLHEDRIEMAEERRGHGLEDGRRDIARAGAHQEALGRLERGKSCHAAKRRRGGGKRKT
jgi:hypothetical protein